ncbi:MAG TPA: SH3 domain-containing protein [Candidatus Polarisedimenticolaceae bacterium]|nr:SH3 domain-containing protein [Candidatus Polarisedimenticolaceae bacterium]
MGVILGGFLLASALAAAAPPAAENFRQAGELARAGDTPKALEIYRDLAGSGVESASLYWNWAQAAEARGAQGEALWALLRAREMAPGDRAVDREIERLRQVANLDPAEIAPDPLAVVARTARRFRLDLVACLLLAISVAAHAALRWRRAGAPLARMAWTALGLGLAVAAVPIAGAYARPTGVVVRRGAPVLDAASPTAESIGSLREGEVVPVLEKSGGYVRVEDSSGVRGWAAAADVPDLTPL